MTPEQFLASRGLADLSLYWPTDKPIPQIDYASGEAKPTLTDLMAAYAKQRVEQAERQIEFYKAWAKRGGELELKVSALERERDEMAKELHAAINEPMYAGTRQDWINRAGLAESKLEKMREALCNIGNIIGRPVTHYAPSSATKEFGGIRKEIFAIIAQVLGE